MSGTSMIDLNQHIPFCKNNSKRYLEIYWKSRYSFDHFRLGISASDSFFDVDLNPTILRRGFKTLLKVQPSVIVSNEDIRSLAVEDRKCRFEDEVPENMKLFKKYSPSACRFECMLNFR